MTTKQTLLLLADGLSDDRLRELLGFAKFLASQPDLSDTVQTAARQRRRSLRGLWRDCSVGATDIEEVRREAWGKFPRENI